MGRTPALIEMFQQSIRIPMHAKSYLQGEAKKLGSINEVFRQMIEDQRTYYELPHNQVERLDADMKRKGITDRRKYIQYVLSRWAEDLAQKPIRGGK